MSWPKAFSNIVSYVMGAAVIVGIIYVVSRCMVDLQAGATSGP